MVEPARRWWIRAIVVCAACGFSGCALAPKSRLDDCHKQCQNLQAETAQLKDTNLKLRADAQDLAQRSVEDARRIKELDETNQRLERSVLGYQQERDELTRAFESFKNQVALGVDRTPAAMLDPWHDFSHAHPGFVFDPQAGTLVLPADQLFEPASAEWSAEAKSILSDLAATLRASQADPASVQLTGPSEPADAQIQRTAGGDPNNQVSERWAERLDRLSAKLNELSGMHIEPANSAPTDTPPPVAGAQRIVLRLAPPATHTDAQHSP
jgi:chemotaxis protein MotB